jgi:Mn-dependent DtxR family transcriptional regulator
MKETLSKKLKDTYAFIAGYIQDNGYSPTTQEIAIKMNVSPQMVDGYLVQLKDSGWITFDENKRFRKVQLV